MGSETGDEGVPSAPPRLPAAAQQDTNWWRTNQAAVLAMLGLGLLGLALAVGHHLFYAYLNNRVVGEAAVPQNSAIQIGTAFAYLFKTMLVAAIGVAYAQCFWFVVRRNSYQIGSLDDFFSILNNPLRFFSRALYGRAVVLFGLALVSWLLPISAVFAPGALTSMPPSCPNFLITATTHKTTLVSPATVPILAPLNTYLGILDPAIAATVEAISYRVLFGGGIVPWTSPCGLNCSYSISFVGPAYQCSDLGPLSSTSINLTEIGLSDRGWLGVPKFPPDNSTILYFGLEYAGNATTPAGLLITANNEQQTIKCELYNATYTATVKYVENEQTVQSDVELHNPITDGNLLWTAGLVAQVNDTGVINDLEFWGRLNLLVLQAMMAAQLTGWVAIIQDPAVGGLLELDANAAYWSGVGHWAPTGPTTSDPSQTLVFTNLTENVQNFFTNVTLSLVHYREANLNVSVLPNVTSDLVIETTVPATSTSFPLVFAYNKSTLWIAYICALGFTTISIVLGSCMMNKNGLASQLSFSQVLVTTRNPTLDKISNGAEMGGKYITDRVKTVRVRYGKLLGTGKMGFGVKDSLDDVLQVP